MDDNLRAILEEQWKMLDVNNDGILERKEFEGFLKNEFKRFNEFAASDGSTAISEAEMEAEVTLEWEKFLASDANGDGKISKAELFDYLEKRGG